MTAPLSVAKLKNLVRLVASGKVVPIVGEDSFTIETPDEPRRLGE